LWEKGERKQLEFETLDNVHDDEIMRFFVCDDRMARGAKLDKIISNLSQFCHIKGLIQILKRSFGNQIF